MGLNDPIKQTEITKWVENYHLSLFAIVETRVRGCNVDKVWGKLRLNGWCLINNNEYCELGRIWVIYKEDKMNVKKIVVTDQVIHCEVSWGDKKFLCSFIYGANDTMGRTSLWRTISQIAVEVQLPWTVLGDFNAILNNSERRGGLEAVQIDCEQFKECIEQDNLIEMKWTCHEFTWNNNQDGDSRVWRRLHKILISEAWLNSFEAKARVLNSGIYDHSPLIIQFIEPINVSHKPLRFFNVWAESNEFMIIVGDSLAESVEGHQMFKVVIKLKRLKRELRKLNRKCFSNISSQVEDMKEQLDEIQNQLSHDVMNSELFRVKNEMGNKYKEFLRWEENIYRQKSRAQWIELGDLNTKFFHRSLMKRQSMNIITQLNVDGVIIRDHEMIRNKIMCYYTELLGKHP
ncbi:uncharacterized protein LOC126681599 [Mercurialis annua]|uniref:uncharacterized protein LOC126681599 n=1 Tax=Mercurialis annua TaxID=3986 RepID=UPI0021601801|nr:uncharacterized protein LOC126681599 [Mercurialis annua]